MTAVPRTDLVRRLAAVADDLGPIVAPVEVRAQLAALCRTVRLALGAAACSVARLDGDELVYEAADGAGSDTIVGTRLPVARGVAGYVVTTGQALAVDQVTTDPRFARDVAERTGFVPDSMLVVPIRDGADVVRGVLSVLDRTIGTVDSLAVASAAAAQVAHVLPTIDAVARLGPLLVRALAEAADGAAHGDLATALRREAERLPEPDGELASLATLVADLRTASPSARAAAERVLRELLVLAAPRARR